MSFKQQHFVLVHGAGHGAWAWVKVVSALEKSGHRATAVDLASAGENKELPDDVTSLEQYSRPLEDLFKSLPQDEKVILVGHSLGGMSMTRMSELFPKKILVAVYLSSVMPGPGQDFNKLRETDADFKPTFQGTMLYHKVKGGPITSMEFPLDKLRDVFYNKCSAEDVAFATARITKYPSVLPLFEPVPVTKENYGSVPRVYILARHDKVIPPVTARKIIALNPPSEIYEIDGDHSMFFSAVEDVEETLVCIAERYGSGAKFYVPQVLKINFKQNR